MTSPKYSVHLIVLSAILAAASHTRAAEPHYLGAWTIESARLAPWADPIHPLAPHEPAQLKGKIITFTAKAISGPRDFTCKNPHYEMSDFTPDLLFQGAFEEMRSKDHRTDPAKVAVSLGFKGAAIRTLQTGCEFDFHFVDDATAEVGLNDYVYTMRRR